MEQTTAIPRQNEFVYTACDYMASIAATLEQGRSPVDAHERGLSPSSESHQEKLRLIIAALKLGKSVRIRSLGCSMLPSIWPGDVLLIENALSERFEPGDIVVIRKSSELLIHRLVSKGTSWVTRGDAMSQADQPVKPEDVLGKVKKIQRGNQVRTPDQGLKVFHRITAFLLCHFQLLRNLSLRVYMVFHRRYSPGAFAG